MPQRALAAILSLALATAFLAASCSVDPNADDAGSSDGDAGLAGDAMAEGSVVSVEQARADCASFFANLYCPAVVACSGGVSVDQSSCLAQVAAEVNCATIIGETSGLAACQADLGVSTCAELQQSLPASCLGVFLPGL